MQPSAEGKEYWAIAADAALERLGVTRLGLSEAEAERRLAVHGPNRLPAGMRRSALMRFALQFHNVLIYVLLAAAFVTALMQHWIDTAVIVAVVVINAIIGFIQEGKAERAMEAVRNMLSSQATVVRDGRINLIAQGEIDKMPVRLPMVEIRTIGAGGGSIATVRAGGRLTVGPESAGSRPGPACYGRGGTKPTYRCQHRARPPDARFPGGGMRLDVSKARRHRGACRAALSLALEPAAEGLLAVTNATLGGAIRLSLFEKGLDPRDFAMIAFGGAAGLHAIAVADELGICRVVFPESASTLSAYGILHSNLAHDLARSKVLAAAADNLGALAAMTQSLVAEATARLSADAVPEGDRSIELSADMRYKGQAFELTIPASGLTFDRGMLDDLVARFHDAHRQRFSYANPGAAVEFVSLRVSAIGRLPPFRGTVASPASERKPTRQRKVWMGGRWREVATWGRGQIAPNVQLKGPAVIEEAYTTVLIADGWSCWRNASGHLIAERAQS
jgi:N-methylhydantoinase A/oxoprolinase/acetone carboxylase beta subunit